MANSKARCPVCGRFQFRLIPGSECYCACGARFSVGETGDERSLKVLHVPSANWRPGLRTITTVKEPAERSTSKTTPFT